MRARFPFLSTRLLAIVAVVCVASCGDKNTESRAPRPVLTVELVSPSHAAWSDPLVASGEIAAWQEAIIGAEVAGIRLEKVLVNVGDVVKKGQLLAHFSEDTLRADLARLDANVAEAAANFEKAKADAARADRLEATNAVSEQTILGYRMQAQAVEAQLASARAQRDAQALQLRYARVVAPDDGVISSRSATIGAVSMMGTELFRLVRRNRLEWRAEVPAESLSRLKSGIKTTVTTLDGKTVTGKLRQLAPTVNTSTRSGLAYVDLPVDSGLAAGMYLTGRFTLAERDVLVIPESAIVLRDGNHYLMQVDAKDRVRAVKVATGQRRDNAIEVLGGVAPTDRFVKSGGAFVGTGDLVQVVAAAKAAP
jgi:HlyD family secretion protein